MPELTGKPERQIKPCPFCESECPLMVQSSAGAVVSCQRCMASGPAAPTEEMAAYLWNQAPRPGD